MLFIPNTTSDATVSKPVTGRYLSHNHLPARRRALLAGDLASGRRHLVKPTLAQAARLARVSLPYAAAGRDVVHCQPHLRTAVESGECALLKAANRISPASAILVRTWNAASPAERVEFIRRVNPDRIFDAAVLAVG
jgi:hypothetical protein